MSYLLQYATRRPTSARGRATASASTSGRCSTCPHFYGDAYVRVFVEDTSRTRVRRRPPPEPRLRLRIADCDERDLPRVLGRLARSVRENSLHKIDTLLAALHRFRDALADEAALYAEREHARANHERRCTMSYLKQHRTRRVPQWPDPGLEPGPEQRRRLRLGGRRLDAAAPLPRPRLRGRQLLRDRVDADARERAGGRALPRGRRRAHGRARSSRSATRAARRRTTRRSSRSRWRRARRRGDAQGRARRAAAGVPHGHAPVPVRARSSRASAAGAARCGARSARWYAAQPADALAYQAVKYRQREGVTHRDLLRLAHPAARGQRGQPDARASRTSTRACSSGSSAAARRTACRAWSRASSGRRRRETPARGGRARPRVRPAARGAPQRAPDLAARSGRRCSRTCR